MSKSPLLVRYEPPKSVFLPDFGGASKISAPKSLSDEAELRKNSFLKWAARSPTALIHIRPLRLVHGSILCRRILENWFLHVRSHRKATLVKNRKVGWIPAVRGFLHPLTTANGCGTNFKIGSQRRQAATGLAQFLFCSRTNGSEKSHRRSRICLAAEPKLLIKTFDFPIEITWKLKFVSLPYRFRLLSYHRIRDRRCRYCEGPVLSYDHFGFSCFFLIMTYFSIFYIS